MNESIASAEYIWLDGAQPTRGLRSKTRFLPLPAEGLPALDALPVWSFDGSSTAQAPGDASDLLLQPVRVVADPLRGGRSILVLCEVTRENGAAHESNTRASLRSVLDAGGSSAEPMVGFEQEYTLYRDGRPLGWPAEGFPAPQGPYYCGVGAQNVFGRTIVEAHEEACLRAGLMIYGTNAEVMAGQWEFQIGYRGVEGESADPLTVADHLWIARWLLQRIAERDGVEISFANKPVQGDWNGAGNHTNFSTRATRDPAQGLDAMHAAIARLEQGHAHHVAQYGHGLHERLTGLHETCSIDEFKHGVADRGASIRIPRQVREQGYGYFEDRRPGANCDPYLVCTALLETVCGIERRRRAA
ncbi:MAG: glutamine synthetase beta-grasp domain-containing protein [Planctomycetota bacterium]